MSCSRRTSPVPRCRRAGPWPNLAADNLIGFLVHGKPLTPLNPEVLEVRSTRVESWTLVALAIANLVLVVALFLRKPPADDAARVELLAANERLERELRREISESSRGARTELTHTLATFQDALVKQGAEATRTQNTQIDAFGQQLTLLQKTLSDTLGAAAAEPERVECAAHWPKCARTLEAQLALLQQTNAAKLDEMRKTVDEKLQTTLETRLGESFKQVADRLEQVHKGLGEMQTLAQGVGDLQRVLTNVKTRGMFGEVQLEALLEQVLTHEQYAKQVETKPRSNQRVDFAIRFPGPQRRRRAGLAADRRQVPARRLRAAAGRAGSRRPGGRRNRGARAGSAHPHRGQVHQPTATSARRTPPTSPSCSCRSKASMPRCCAAPA